MLHSPRLPDVQGQQGRHAHEPPALADTFEKTYSENEDEATETNTELCYTLPCSQMSEDSRADRHQCPITDSLDRKFLDEEVHLHLELRIEIYEAT